MIIAVGVIIKEIFNGKHGIGEIIPWTWFTASTVDQFSDLYLGDD